LNTVYWVQPNRIWSDLPKNINDNELGEFHTIDRPLSEPTTMSYNLQRLKIAEIARCISDQMPQDVNDATCELILSLDSKLEALILQLPAFFRVETAGSDETARIDRVHPQIPMQRLLINFMVNLIRCKLHFPFLAGHSSRAVHRLSREASLKAARRVLSVYREMSMTNVSHSSDFMKIQGIVFHMFTGALILATDLCCNEFEGNDRERQSDELMGVLKRLDCIREYSQSAARFLGTLNELLVKHGVWPSDASVLGNIGNELSTTVDSAGPELENMQGQDYETLEPFPYEELWDTFVERPSGLDLYFVDH
jgi:hypothetical protein